MKKGSKERVPMGRTYKYHINVYIYNIYIQNYIWIYIYIIIYGIYVYPPLFSFPLEMGDSWGLCWRDVHLVLEKQVLLSQQGSLRDNMPLTMYTWVGGQIHVRNRTNILAFKLKQAF